MPIELLQALDEEPKHALDFFTNNVYTTTKNSYRFQEKYNSNVAKET